MRSLFSLLARRRVTTQRCCLLPSTSRKQPRTNNSWMRNDANGQGVCCHSSPSGDSALPKKQCNRCVWERGNSRGAWGSVRCIIHVESPVTPYIRAALNLHMLQPHAVIYNATNLRWKTRWSTAGICSPCLRLQCKREWISGFIDIIYEHFRFYLFIICLFFNENIFFFLLFYWRVKWIDESKWWGEDKGNSNLFDSISTMIQCVSSHWW